MHLHQSSATSRRRLHVAIVIALLAVLTQVAPSVAAAGNSCELNEVTTPVGTELVTTSTSGCYQGVETFLFAETSSTAFTASITYTNPGLAATVFGTIHVNDATASCESGGSDIPAESVTSTINGSTDEKRMATSEMLASGASYTITCTGTWPGGTTLPVLRAWGDWRIGANDLNADPPAGMDTLFMVAGGGRCSDKNTSTLKLMTMWAVVSPFFGSETDDVIGGLPGNDNINAGPGDDIVCAAGGNDIVQLGPGDDQGYGQDGDDKIYGAQGADYVLGGLGDDVIHGNRGNDELWGQGGNDRIFGYANDDKIIGGPGDDRLHGNFGNDEIWGEAGADRIFGYGDDDLLSGGPGDDLLGGNFGNDELFGDGGNDTMYGSDGNDRLAGGDGNDLLQGNSSNDELFGEAGNDELDGGIGSDACNGGAGSDTATRCENVTSIP